MSWTVYNSDGQILQGSSTLADGSVTVAKMAANSIDSTQYVDGSIDTAHIGNDQVTGAKLNPSLVLGDIIYADGTDTIARLAKGSADEVLTMGGSNAPTWAAASAVSQATESAIKAETNQDTYIPPDLIKFHPGVAKAWCLMNQTGTQAVRTSYNIASINDQAVGRTRVTFVTNMDAAIYAVTGAAGTGDHNAICRAQDVAFYDMDCDDNNGTYVDDDSISGVCHGAM